VRWGIGGALLLFLALLGVDARASVPSAEVVHQMVAATEATSESAPAMGDFRPCAYCYAGPATTVHGFSGESKEQDVSAWVALAKAAPAQPWHAHCDGRRPSPLPVRIAYCRWSN
jgi:hypothetical protein